MYKGLQWKIILIIAITALALFYCVPPFDIKDKDNNLLNKGKLNLGLDLQGGMHLVLRVDTSKLTEVERKGAVDRALEIIRNRVDKFGVSEPLITKQGVNNIVVQLPGFTERQRAIDIIGKTALLEFRLVSDDPELMKQALDEKIPQGYELKYLGPDPLLLKTEASLTGDAINDATVDFSSSQFGEPNVSLSFSQKGSQTFAKLTGDNVGKRLAIVLDGVVQSAPVIRERIPSGRAQISGNFSSDEAKDLAIILRSGKLPCPLVIEEERTIGPLLGQDSIHSGINASLVGAAITVVFMLVYYLFAGLVANVALLLNLVLILGCLGFFHATLTLPGIAGLILTIGMAVDANVLIYERIREELALGKTIRAAIQAGYHKAFTAIFDSNVTTLIAAALLFRFGTGPIRGFALTLTIGVVANLFTAITVTRVIFELLLNNNRLQNLKMLQIFPKLTKFDFIGKRHICYAISAIIIISGLFIFWKKGEKNYGVDFSGGTVYQYEFEKDIDINKLRAALNDLKIGEVSIQLMHKAGARGGSKAVMIRTQNEESKKIEAQFKEKFADNKYTILQLETVGPAAGKDLRSNAAWSLLLGILGIFIYVAIRFNIVYAYAGVIGLFHDAIIAIGALAITGRQFDLTIVAALLTIAGYSINDTVVIYDRIRENIKTVKKGTFAEIINLTVNQMLPRTILTNSTVLVVTLVLFLFGGEVLNNFSFCLLIGFISGVYSTVFISGPLIIMSKRGAMLKK